MNTFANCQSKKNKYHTCIPLSPTSHLAPDSCMSPVLCQDVTLCLPCTGPAGGPTPLSREHSVSAVHVTHDCSLLARVHCVWKYSLMTATSKNSFHIITSSKHIIMSSSEVQGVTGTVNHLPFNFTELNWYLIIMRKTGHHVTQLSNNTASQDVTHIIFPTNVCARLHNLCVCVCGCVQLRNLTRHHYEKSLLELLYFLALVRKKICH